MPREARQKSKSGIYHVMLRGINRQTIFIDDEDYEKYLQFMSEIKEKSGFILYAYCLMGNHIHLLIKEGNEPIQQIFKRIGARYVFWYNWKYKRCGHLFQDRFKSEPIEDELQLLAVLRYIYQNPVKAGICNNIEDYRWSSYRCMEDDTALTDINMITDILSVDQLRTYVKGASEEQFLDISSDKRLTDKEAIELIKRISGIEHAYEYQNMAFEILSQYIRKLYSKGCSIRQISRITGITKAKIEKALRY